MGYALTRAGKPGEAVKLLERGAKLEPENKAIAEHLADAKKRAAALPPPVVKPVAKVTPPRLPP